MSHNPTYDPEPGYDKHDLSGHNTPPQYHNWPAQPAATADQYSNMASYRQATSGPPASSGDPTNGKSYRYATEAIPEDEDEPDNTPGVDSRQVQFSNGGEPTKRISSSNYGDSCWDRYKFFIMCLIAVLFAILWVIFLGLYIQQVTSDNSSEGPKTGEVVDKATTQKATVTQQPTTTIAPTEATTTVPVVQSDIGEYPAGSGSKVTKFLLTNNNDMKVELLSLGARVNSIIFNNAELLPGFLSETGTVNLTEMAKQNLGSANGRICSEVAGNSVTYGGSTYTLDPVDGQVDFSEGGMKGFYQMNFMGMRTSDGVKFTRTITATDDGMPPIKVEIMYTLNDNNELKVVMNAMNENTNQNTLIDMCSSMRFRLDSATDIKQTHFLTVYNDQFLNSNYDWVAAGEARAYDFTSRKPLSGLNVISDAVPTSVYDAVYGIPGATGLKNVALLESDNSNIQVMIRSNQDSMRMLMNNDANFEVTGRETYVRNQFIGIITHATPRSANNNQRDIELKGGAKYEHMTVYHFSTT